MPDDAVKTTDAEPRSAREAKIVSARKVQAQGADARAPDAPEAAGTAAAAHPAAPRSPADAGRPESEAAATDGPAAKGNAGTKTEPTLTMPAAAAGATEKSIRDKAATATGEEATLFGGLDADQRIRQSMERNERTLWAGAVVATLVYVALIGGQMVTGFATPVTMEQRQKERRGQGADSISVEIVPDPDKTAKTKRWHEGAQAPSPTPNQQPPQPQQMASIAPPEVPEADKQEKQEDTKETDKQRSEDSPMLLDIDSLVDAAAADLKREIDRHYDKQARRRTQQALQSGGGMQVRGTGASGRSDPFTRSVIAALMKTRPGPHALWGRVLVSFQVTESGKLAYVHLLHSSGNSALDQAAIDAIRRARFQRPPPGLTADDRTYIIDYIFG